ncbi:DEAD-box ATP-dependent RNA helicase 14 [Dorcoceras hygrometricum]|uniref:DEAD-box ATP-dependent RNA helicase 14 n=1 Tax=Dorcoceras hygrometricum TaxID=472368 RepID=A0A2Z7CGG7_9LAMI|nr:DEAD-box ATP-dependent RNA helicase 14 [Dorcoceras hygrometricum]
MRDAHFPAFVLSAPATVARDPPAEPPPGPSGSNGTNHGPNHGSQCAREGHEDGCPPCAAHQVHFTYSHDDEDLRGTGVVDARSGCNRVWIAKLLQWRKVQIFCVLMEEGDGW